jgi:hypothetical protein
MLAAPAPVISDAGSSATAGKALFSPFSQINLKRSAFLLRITVSGGRQAVYRRDQTCIIA